MRDKSIIKRKHTAGRPSIESLVAGEMCLVVPENLIYIKKDFENLLPLSTGGKQCILVSSFGTPTENGVALQAAYDDAKTRLPSPSNPITIVATPGRYTFPYYGFVMDTPYINLVSLDGNRSLLFDVDTQGIDPYGNPENQDYSKLSCLWVLANNVFVKGVEAGYTFSPFLESVLVNSTFRLPIFLSESASIVMENCKGGDLSFGTLFDYLNGYPSYSYGTFINCEGEHLSFGHNSLGRYIDCVGGNASFGFNSSGVYINCTGGGGSFGGNLSASGTYKYCTGADGSFGSDGSNGSLTGKLLFCQKTSGNFGSVSSGGRTIYCIDGNNNPNNQ